MFKQMSTFVYQFCNVKVSAQCEQGLSLLTLLLCFSPETRSDVLEWSPTSSAVNASTEPEDDERSDPDGQAVHQV